MPADVDVDGDSQMHSSPSASSSASTYSSPGGGAPVEPSTPKNTYTYPLHPSSELSPPNSQPASARASTAGRSDLFTLPSNPSSGEAGEMDVEANGKNANGKRTLAAADDGVGAGGGSGVEQPAQVVGQQGRVEDEPGYAWRNKKAQEEYARAMDQIVDKDRMIGNKYGDLFDVSPTRS